MTELEVLDASNEGNVPSSRESAEGSVSNCTTGTDVGDEGKKDFERCE